MRTRESEEMYLETILLLKKKKGNVRSVDVVEELGYAKSSVSRAVNLLIQKGYVNMDRNGDLTLTASGEEKASSVFERHYYITRALIKIGADAALAEGGSDKGQRLSRGGQTGNGRIPVARKQKENRAYQKGR